MKEVKYLVTLKTHDMLDEKELTELVGYYLINKESFEDMKQYVIGGDSIPENFNLEFVSLDKYEEKPVSKAKTKPKSKK